MSAALPIGYVPLVDAAPLLVAEALGFAEEEGLTLTLHPAPSWAALRDMLALGQVAAAQMLSPVPVAMALGLGGSAARFEALSVLNVNGNVFAVSLPLAAQMREAGHDFGFDDALQTGRTLLTVSDGALRIGVPFPFSMHVELVEYWLSGLNLPRPAGLEIITVPPPRMGDALAAGEIDAFMVGEPWGSVAVAMGVAELLLPGAAIWAFAPEKVLATRQGWAEAEPDLAGGLLRAVWRSGRWLGQKANHAAASEILAAPGRLRVAPEIIERALNGNLVISPQGQERRIPGFMEFHAGAASFPWRSQAAWIAVQMANRYGFNPVDAAKAASATFRSDLHRLHLAETGADLPGASEKLEGALAHSSPVASERGKLILPRDRFFDARIFDPADPLR